MKHAFIVSIVCGYHYNQICKIDNVNSIQISHIYIIALLLHRSHSMNQTTVQGPRSLFFFMKVYQAVWIHIKVNVQNSLQTWLEAGITNDLTDCCSPPRPLWICRIYILNINAVCTGNNSGRWWWRLKMEFKGDWCSLQIIGKLLINHLST